jgi:capsid protein
MKAPEGYDIEGWNANLPSESFFEHSALLLTMLAVNLDIPLMFLLLDGSLVNFHGGRMTFDQAKLRFRKLQRDQISGLWGPTYEWKMRQKLTPGTPLFDPRWAAAAARGANVFNYEFRPAAWPYVKPLEDAAGEDLSERRNLKSHRSILSNRGVDLDDHRKEVINDRAEWFETAFERAGKTLAKYPDAADNQRELARLYAYGTDTGAVQLVMNASGEESPAAPAQPTGGQRGS